uniref:NADH dehydrogenase subunit 6 n=1 Tax=Tinaminyssus melloi TaxID=105222 RepID=A0A5Q0RZX8_9ACAR|nr:NADH dehydrogenase subunit 6 [Tinaminyssus melloi]QGA47515.1 NADH dehydrogenase subunit 6 [Tinaminyssus melloi]
MITMMILCLYMSYSMNNPLSLIMYTIMSIFFMNLFTSFMNNTPWMMLLFTLLNLGGLMIIFIYMASINTSTSYFKKNKILTMAILITLYMLSNMNMYNINFSNTWYNNVEWTQISMLTLFTMYLLMIMTLILNMSSTMKSPLRASQ